MTVIRRWKQSYPHSEYSRTTPRNVDNSRLVSSPVTLRKISPTATEDRMVTAYKTSSDAMGASVSNCRKSCFPCSCTLWLTKRVKKANMNTKRKEVIMENKSCQRCTLGNFYLIYSWIFQMPHYGLIS